MRGISETRIEATDARRNPEICFDVTDMDCSFVDADAKVECAQKLAVATVAPVLRLGRLKAGAQEMGQKDRRTAASAKFRRELLLACVEEL